MDLAQIAKLDERAVRYSEIVTDLSGVAWSLLFDARDHSDDPALTVWVDEEGRVGAVAESEYSPREVSGGEIVDATIVDTRL